MATISDVRAIENPQAAYMFEVELLGSVAGGDLPVLTAHVQNTAIPEETIEKFIINFKDNQTQHAGRDGSGHTHNVTYWEDESGSIYRFHKNWKENGILNSTVGGGVTRDLYAAQMRIKKLSRDGETVVQSVLLTNVFVETIGEQTLSYEGSEALTLDITYSFDRIILE